MLKIRAALPTDAAAIARVSVDCWPALFGDLIDTAYREKNLTYEVHEQQWQEILAYTPSTDRFTFVLYSSSQEIFGFVRGGPGTAPLSKDTGEIYSMAIHPSRQKLGYGRDLLAEGLTQIALRAYEKAAVWSIDGNPLAEIYQHSGATVGQTRPMLIGEQQLNEHLYSWTSLAKALKQLRPDQRHPAIRTGQELLGFDNSSYAGSEERLGISASFGRFFGLKNIGLHYEYLAAGRRTSMPHAHEDEDEFIYVISGHPQVWIDGERYPLKPGDGIGFPAGTGMSHTFINDSDTAVELLVLGDRPTPRRRVFYSLHPELNDKLGSYYWKDHPRRPLGLDSL